MTALQDIHSVTVEDAAIAAVYAWRDGVLVKIWGEEGAGGTLTVSASPANVYGGKSSKFAVDVDTPPVTATPAGGVPPYTYAWTLSVGTGWTILDDDAATTAFRASSVAAAATKTATFEIEVTDSLGATATDTVEATAENYGG